MNRAGAGAQRSTGPAFSMEGDGGDACGAAGLAASRSRDRSDLAPIGPGGVRSS